MPSTKTAIEWTDRTWNPTTGCNKVSPGCKFCYAEVITERFPQHFPNGFEFTLRADRLNEPKRWRTPSRIFVNSMSDLFHEEIVPKPRPKREVTLDAPANHKFHFRTSMSISSLSKSGSAKSLLKPTA